MATIDIYKIKVEVSGDRDVKKLQDGVDGLTDKLDSASTAALGFAAAAGAAFAAVAVDAFKMADSLVDVAGGVGMATSKVYQLALAAEASGGQFDDAAKLLGKFGQSIDMAAKGSEIMQDDLAKLGISLDDLRNLSAEELFNKAAQGAAELGTGLDATATTMAVFGKAAREINFQDLAVNMGKNGAEAETAAALMEKAAEAAGKIEVAYRNLQIVALQVFEPILDALTDLEGTHKKVRDTVITMGTAFAALAGLGVAMSFIKMATAAIQFARAVSAVVASTTVLVGLTGVGLVAVGAAVAAGTAAYFGLSAAIDGVAEGIEDTGDSAKDTTDALDKLNKTAAEGNDPRPVREVLDLNQAQVEAAKAKTEQLQSQIDNANELRRKTIDLIGTETNLANLKKANLNAENQAKTQIAAIEAQINTELGKGVDANQDVVAELRQQQRIIESNLQTTKELNDIEYRRLLNLQAQQQAIATGGQVLDFQIQEKYYESVLHAMTKIGEVRQALLDSARLELETNKLIVATGDAISQQLLGQNADLEKRDIINHEIGKFHQEHLDALKDTKNEEEAIQVIRELQRQTIQNMRDRGIEISEEEQKILEILMSQLYNKTQLVHMQQYFNGLLKDQNNAQQGALDALDQISQKFTPYQMAQDAVLSTWQNIGGAIDDLVDNGKASFSDLAKSILKDLAKMILKAMLFKYIFDPIMGALGLQLPTGRAKGGPVSGNTPYMVGEQGPELFVPRSAGEIIPNNKLGSMSAGPGTVNAPVTNTYITNQISAVDAKSVAQLFVENRQLLLGSVQMAQKELP